MALSPIPSRAITDVRAAFDLFAAPHIVQRRGDPATLAVPMSIRPKRADEMTDGITGSTNIATVRADQWDTIVGRRPERGDTIMTPSGYRYGVVDVTQGEMQGVPMFYYLQVRG